MGVFLFPRRNEGPTGPRPLPGLLQTRKKSQFRGSPPIDWPLGPGNRGPGPGPSGPPRVLAKARSPLRGPMDNHRRGSDRSKVSGNNGGFGHTGKIAPTNPGFSLQRLQGRPRCPFRTQSTPLVTGFPGAKPLPLGRGAIPKGALHIRNFRRSGSSPTRPPFQGPSLLGWQRTPVIPQIPNGPTTQGLGK